MTIGSMNFRLTSSLSRCHPHDLQIHPKIIVYQLVSHPRNLVPVYLRISVPQFV